MTSILNVQNLTTRLASEQGWVHAIEGLSLAIEKGQTYALVGESGCGKSMTALSIARLLPDSGAIFAGNIDLSNYSEKDSEKNSEKDSKKLDVLRISESAMRNIRGKRISMIFQEPGTSLNPVMTVGDQLAEVICLHQNVSKSEALAQAAMWLDKVGIPEPKARLAQYPFEMSGGQKQRVMIAMALAVKPDVLIADEPTTALDVSIQAQVLNLLAQLQKEQGMAMLLITHDLGIVQQMADHVGLMYAGQLVESSTAKEFFKQPRHPYARALIRSLPSQAQRGHALYTLEGRVPSLVNPKPGCRFADRCEFAIDACRDATPELQSVSASSDAVSLSQVRCIRWMDIGAEPISLNPTSKQISNITSIAPSQPTGVVLQAVSLGVSYPVKKGLFQKDWKPVLKNLSLDLVRGKTVALVGESGSGKTTAARAILGLLSGAAKLEGQILFAGTPLSAMPERGANGWRSKIQFVFQDPFASLNPRHRVLQILEESLINLRPELDAEQRLARIQKVIGQVSMPEEALRRFPHEFSGGQRQRIAIARALVSEPQVLICDEPTSALDVSVQAQILNLLRKLQLETGVAMLFITHNLSVVQYLADEVVVLRHGEVVERNKTDQLFAKAKNAYTRELIKAAPRVTLPS
ncbi:MAG: dipeptide ABC transporter ATP-binding protein [Limnobacter sp.]|nr:dipeptide ABC transporter ATP-binding protein [Limnobacter sp.]